MWNLEVLRIAFGAMVLNKFRATLTMLGIIIGVGAVIAMMAMGEGAKRAIEESITSMIDSDATINSGPDFNRGAGDRDMLSYDDYVAVRDHCSGIKSLVPMWGGWSSQQIRYRNRMAPAPVVATVPGFFPMYHLRVAQGRRLTQSDGANIRQVCVLGADIAEKLRVSPRIIGETVQLTGWGMRSYEVVGVLEPTARTLFGANLGDDIYVPIETNYDRISGRIPVAGINVRLAPGTSVYMFANEAARALRRSKKLAKDQPNNFNIVPTFDFSALRMQASQTFGSLLLGIAAVSLLVGGIGVMNIMFVSVSERTREIGIRKALGATRLAILGQFVTEAMALCALGGAVGVALGYGVARFMATSAGWATVVTPHSVLLGIGVSVGIGLFFGIYPAWRASRLDPVEALRYE